MWRAHISSTGVAVDDLPVGVDENRAVAVPVERDPEPAALLTNDVRKTLRVCGTAIQIDVPAVGRRADHLDVVTEFSKDPRCDRRRRSMRSVDRQLESAKASWIGEREQRVRNIGVGYIRRRDRFVRAALDSPARVSHDRFDFAFDCLGKLFTAPGEHLDAVVFERIVRGGNHDPGIEPERAGYIRDRGGRDHAGTGHLATLGSNAAGELTRDPVTRFARVAADDEAQRLADAMAMGSHGPNEGAAETRHRLMIEWMLAGLAANAVSSEKSGHAHLMVT